MIGFTSCVLFTKLANSLNFTDNHTFMDNESFPSWVFLILLYRESRLQAYVLASQSCVSARACVLCDCLKMEM